MRRKAWLTLIVWCLALSAVRAQVQIAWDVYPGETAIEAAANYVYRVFIDSLPVSGSDQADPNPSVLVEPVCTAFCVATLPLQVPGTTHTVYLRAFWNNLGRWSLPSPVLYWLESGTSEPPPPPERCGLDGYGNGIDDDGDGVIDEDCATPPPAPATSPDGAISPPATQIVDADSEIWTIDAERRTLRNGVWANNGIADVVLWYGGRVYVFNAIYPDANGSWYRWDVIAWAWLGNGATADPRYVAPPPPAEICGPDGYGNGVDDDGDGLIDETCAVRPPPPPPADTTAPVITALVVKRSGNSSNFQTSVSATDNVGVVRIDLFLDNARVMTCTASPCVATVSLKQKGAHTISAAAFDAAGNSASIAQLVTR
jgi:hypothetical protein